MWESKKNSKVWEGVCMVLGAWYAGMLDKDRNQDHKSISTYVGITNQYLDTVWALKIQRNPGSSWSSRI